MTAGGKLKRKERMSTVLSIALLLLSLYFSGAISSAVRDSLKMCINSVVPTVFPFMIISEFISASASSPGPLSRIFGKIFGMNDRAACAYAVGCTCGFPVGAKSACDLRRTGIIGRDESERLMAISNSASPAFVIAAVGAGMRGSISDGIALYSITLISSAITGIILRGRRKNEGQSDTESRCGDVRENSFELVRSVRNAAENTLYICAFTAMFGAVYAIAGKCIKSGWLYLAIAVTGEVSSAASFLSSPDVSEPLSFILTAFALSFTGLSVFLQSAVFAAGTDIRMHRYLIFKLLQGIVASLVATALVIAI